MKEIARGAEAVLYKDNLAIIKERVKKGYRIEELDNFLRKSRTKREANILRKLSQIKNASVPQVREERETSLVMDFIEGKQLKEVIHLDPELAKQLGKAVAELHDLNIIHGDITTSNVIVNNNGLFLIDFGLSYYSAKSEDKAVDIHVFKQTLESKHSKIFEEAYNNFLKGYVTSIHSSKVLERLKEVEERGRYKKKG